MSYDHNIRHPDRTTLSMELLYFCDLKGEWLDFIYTFSQLQPGSLAGALGRYVLCGVGLNSFGAEWCMHPSSAHANIGTDNGLFPIRCQARTNGGILLTETLGKKFTMTFGPKCKHSIHENAFENVVCETAVILSRARCVKTWLCNE